MALWEGRLCFPSAGGRLRAGVGVSWAPEIAAWLALTIAPSHPRGSGPSVSGTEFPEAPWLCKGPGCAGPRRCCVLSGDLNRPPRRFRDQRASGGGLRGRGPPGPTVAGCAELHGESQRSLTRRGSDTQLSPCDPPPTPPCLQTGRRRPALHRTPWVYLLGVAFC